MHQKRKNLIIKASAKQDIEEIFLYSLKEFGFKKAEKYIREIDNVFNKLLDNGHSGRIYKHRIGYRFYMMASHFIFCRNHSEKIIIIRILHKSMKYEKRL